MLKTQYVEGTVGRMWSDVLPAQFADSLAKMLLFSQSRLPEGRFISYEIASASWHELGRQELVDNSLGEWLLMLDTDHVMAPDILERMLRLRAKYKTRVLSAIYLYKKPPYRPVANLWGPKGEILPLTTWDRKAEIMEIGPVGAGCLLINRDVFVEIKTKLKEMPFAIRPGLSEDYSFAARCRELGIKMHLAPQVEAHHLTLERNALHVGDYQE